MALQRLLRFAACEHREVIYAIKQAAAAALPRPSALVLQWHSIDATCGEAVPLIWSAVSLRGEMRQNRMVTLSALGGLR